MIWKKPDYPTFKSTSSIINKELYSVSLILFTILALIMNSRGFWIRPFWLDEVTTFHTIEAFKNAGFQLVVQGELQPSLFHSIATFFQNETYEAVTLRIFPVFFFLAIYCVIFYYAANKSGLFFTFIWAYLLTDNAYANWIMSEYRPYSLSLLGHIMVQSSLLTNLIQGNTRQRDILMFAVGLFLVMFTLSINIISVCIYCVLFFALLNSGKVVAPEGSLFYKIKWWTASKIVVLGWKWSVVFAVILSLYVLFLVDVISQGTELYRPKLPLSYNEAIIDNFHTYWKSISNSQFIRWGSLISLSFGVYFSSSRTRLVLISLIVATIISYCFVVYITHSRISWFSVRYLSPVLPLYWLAVAISCQQLFAHFISRRLSPGFNLSISLILYTSLVLIIFSKFQVFNDTTKFHTSKHDILNELHLALDCNKEREIVFIFPRVASETAITQDYAAKTIQFAYRKKNNTIVPYADNRYSKKTDIVSAIEAATHNKSCIILGAKPSYESNIKYVFEHYLEPVGYTFVKDFNVNKQYAYKPFDGLRYFSLYSLKK